MIRNLKRVLPENADVVIIGGGIIGVSAAYYLAKNNIGKIILLEKDNMGEGSTGKCVGGIRSHFSTRINIEFSLLSLKIFNQFQSEFGVDPEFHRTGYLFLAATRKQWSILKSNALLMESMGLQLDLLESNEIARHWPFLKTDDLIGAAYSENDGYAGPYEVLQGYVKGARKMGAWLFEGIEVTDIEVRGGRVKAVVTSTGLKIKTPIVVNASGPYAAITAAMADLKLPVKPLRRQLFFTDEFKRLPSHFPIVIDMEYGWYMRRESRVLLLSGPQDKESSFNKKTDFEAKEWTAERSLYRVPVLEHAKIANGWAGLYEISPDHHAVIGKFPEAEGFICANGFSGHGFMHGPATGILLSELILHGETRSLDIYPLRPSRFRENDLIHEPLTAFKS
jgi:sarcosine oxidase subunit beta